MKKLLAAFLCLTMAFSLAACGDSQDAGKTDKKKDSKDDGKKVYQVATDTTFAPFEFENDEGDMVGIDLDILAAIAEDQGFEYKLQIVGFQAAVNALEAGQADAVIAGMSITCLLYTSLWILITGMIAEILHLQNLIWSLCRTNHFTMHR